MGKRTESQDKLVIGSPGIPAMTTMMWCPDGTIAVIGGIESVVSFHRSYETAAAEFIQNCRDIHANRPHVLPREYHDNLVGSFMETCKKNFLSQEMIDKSKLEKFKKTSQLAIQFSRVGASAFILTNMEEFRYLTSLDEIESLVPELFLSVPRIHDAMSRRDESGDRFVDPEIRKLIDEMNSEQRPSSL